MRTQMIMDVNISIDNLINSLMVHVAYKTELNGLGLFFVSMMSRKRPLLSIMAKTYHIGCGIYFMAQMVYER